MPSRSRARNMAAMIIANGGCIKNDVTALMSGEKIKAIRNDWKFSQSELARILRIKDLRTIRRWETGDIPISGPASIIMELMESGELPSRYMMTYPLPDYQEAKND